MTTTTRTDSWLAVDRRGLAENMTEEQRSRAVLELLQNCLDAGGTTEVRILLRYEGRATWELTVTDDSPSGFADLTHSYTLYARSEKRNDPTKRGRFNEGEKKVLALCREALVVSTTGAVAFRADGVREEAADRRQSGSSFLASLNLTKLQGEQALRLVEQAIIPPSVAVYLNGERLPSRTPVLDFEVPLPTVVEDEEGKLGERVRRTTVRLYEPEGSRRATLFEMGIPVVELGDDRFDVSIEQKVPLNRDRDNVRPAWLRRLRAEVANHAHGILSADDAAARWVSTAVAAPEVTPETVRAIVEKRYGEKAVTFDPSDREANAIAASQGYTVVPPRAFDREAWRNIRDSGALLPAGQVTPSPAVLFSADGGPGTGPSIPAENWSTGMERVAIYAVSLTKALIGVDLTVDFYRRLQGREGSSASACWGRSGLGPARLAFALQTLGHGWFDSPDGEVVDALLLHEMAHEAVGNHSDARYADEVARLGSKLRNVEVRP